MKIALGLELILQSSCENPKIKHEQEAQLKEIFDLFDTDGGGTIDRQEVSPLLVLKVGSTLYLPHYKVISKCVCVN